MNSDDLALFKQTLIANKVEIQRQEEAYKETGSTVVLDQTRVGRVSRMDAMQSQQMALESARRRKQKIQMIEGALKRIESDEYGYCFVCAETIALPRLNADPTVTRCVNCAD